MAGRLGRPYGLARGAGTPVVVEEKIIARAEISRPGAVPGAPPSAAISLDTHKRIKRIVESYAGKGMCVSVTGIAEEASLSPEEAEAHLKVMETDEFGNFCCDTHFCSHTASSEMLKRIKRWRGEG